jgi:hypothetical protein
MNPPEVDRKLLKEDVFELDEDDEDIFAITLLGNITATQSFILTVIK